MLIKTPTSTSRHEYYQKITPEQLGINIERKSGDDMHFSTKSER